MIKSRIISGFAAVTLALCGSAPASGQSLNRLVESLPGLMLEEILRAPKGPLGQPPAQPRVVIDAIPAAQCRSIQAALHALNFPVGTVDGQCGPRTRHAIAQFQASLGANATGNLTDAQQRSLMAQAANVVRPEPAPAPIPAAPVQVEPLQASAVQAKAQLAGIWDGTYICGQGQTMLTLTFENGSGGEYRGSFAFGALPGQNNVPNGAYEVIATFEAGNKIKLTPGRWIDQPSGYASASLEGTISPDGNQFEGKILAESCGAFKVSRRDTGGANAADAPAPSGQPVIIADAPAAAPTIEPPSIPAVPPPPEEPRDADIDCAVQPSAARADCEVFKRHAVAVYFGADAATASIARACAALETAWSEATLLDCLAGGYALRDQKRIPRMLFADGWNGLGPILESAETCSALTSGIGAVASAVTGTRGNAPQTTDQAQCQQMAMMAISRQSRPAWGSCAIGTDPALVHLECRPADESRFVGQWKAAAEACAADKTPDALNRAIADAAKSAGREAPEYSCEEIEKVAVDDGILTADDFVAAREKVAAAKAAEVERLAREAEAAERERERRAAAAEAARIEAEERRLAEIAQQERIARERAANPLYQILQVPSSYASAARAIELGDSFNFTDGTMLFTAGIAGELLENCRSDLDTAARLELAAFVSSASLQAGGGNSYSAPSIGDMMADQAASLGAFTVGVVAARGMQCAGASQMLEHIAKLVRDNKRGRDGGVSPFIASCSPVHGQASCTCLAELGRASYSNIYQMQYSRQVVYGIIQNNPMAGLMIAMSCGIQNY